MRTFAALAFLVACGVSVFGPLSGCSCTDVGCANGVSTTLNVAGDTASLAGAIVKVCRNDECREVTLDTSGDSDELYCDLTTGAGDLIQYCLGKNSGDGVAVALTIAAGENDEFDVEDEFSFAIVSASDPDEVLAQAEGKALYLEYSPNGEFCEPTCYSGTI